MPIEMFPREDKHESRMQNEIAFGSFLSFTPDSKVYDHAR